MEFFNDCKNAQTNLIDRPYNVRSDGLGGASSFILGSTDLIIPTSPNYPPTASGASTSYYISLPWAVYRTSTNSTYFQVYNATQNKYLTIIEPSASLDQNYTCKFFSPTSERRNILEVHVGSTSCQPSDVLAYKIQAEGNILDESNLNNFNIDNITVRTLTCSSNLNVTYGITEGINIYSTTAISKLTCKKTIIRIPAISLYAALGEFSFSHFAGSMISPTNIIDYEVIIFPDSGYSNVKNRKFSDVSTATWQPCGVMTQYTTSIIELSFNPSDNIFSQIYYASTTQDRGQIIFYHT